MEGACRLLQLSCQRSTDSAVLCSRGAAEQCQLAAATLTATPARQLRGVATSAAEEHLVTPENLAFKSDQQPGASNSRSHSTVLASTEAASCFKSASTAVTCNVSVHSSSGSTATE